LLGVDKYRLIASKCDEVFGEIKTVNEDDFQKAQRPLTGYTLSEYVNNMASFRQQYRGRFIFAVTLIAGYNDDEASVEKICAIIRAIVSDEVVVRRMEDERFKRKLGINDGDFERISKKILTSGLPGQEGSNRVLNTGTWQMVNGLQNETVIVTGGAKGIGRPEDIAGPCLFLADENNDFITGQNFVIDGGMTKKMICLDWVSLRNKNRGRVSYEIQNRHYRSDAVGRENIGSKQRL
jgi:hypothetical protein